MPADAALWQHLADMVHAKYPKLTVKLQNSAWNDYWTKMPTQLTSSGAPCIVTTVRGPVAVARGERTHPR